MAHHTTPKIQVPSAIEDVDLVYVRTDAVRRPYTGPFRVVQKSAKYFTIMKNGHPDTVSIDQLKPAFQFENNNIGKQVPVKLQSNVTQPPDSSPSEETDEFPKETPEVARKSYSDVLCCNPPSSAGNEPCLPKRTYVKRKNEMRQEPATLRSGRISRPPDRL